MYKWRNKIRLQKTLITVKPFQWSQGPGNYHCRLGLCTYERRVSHGRAPGTIVLSPANWQFKYDIFPRPFSDYYFFPLSVTNIQIPFLAIWRCLLRYTGDRFEPSYLLTGKLEDNIYSLFVIINYWGIFMEMIFSYLSLSFCTMVISKIEDQFVGFWVTCTKSWVFFLWLIRYLLFWGIIRHIM